MLVHMLVQFNLTVYIKLSNLLLSIYDKSFNFELIIDSMLSNFKLIVDIIFFNFVLTMFSHSIHIGFIIANSKENLKMALYSHIFSLL